MTQHPSEPSNRKRGFATRAVQGRQQPVPAEHPVSTPIYQTSTFAFDDAERFAEALERPGHGFSYTRYENPTTAELEATVADLEGGVRGLAAASGMGAIAATLLGLLGTGGHIVLQRSLYGGTYALVNDVARRFGVESTFVDPTDMAAVRAAIRPETRVLYAETISNPTLEVGDLPGWGVLSRETGIPLMVDNTVASPYFCRPIEHGASIVVHSATKYLGGHSDVIAGIAVYSTLDHHQSAWKAMLDLGASADPFASWLVLRGIKTLPLRMRRHSETAGEVACWLAEHPAVKRVYWPGLPDHPSHALATKILDGYSGMLAFELAGGRDAGRRFIESTEVAKLAASLGGVETLLAHPASTTHRQLDPSALAHAGIGEGLIRVSIGLEDAADLIADFAQALDRSLRARCLLR